MQDEDLKNARRLRLARRGSAQRLRTPLGYRQMMLRSARKRAKQKRLPFTLTLADIILPERCPILGFTLELAGPDPSKSPSLDRIVPARGYVPGNIAIISFRANKIKASAGSADEMAAIARDACQVARWMRKLPKA